MAAEEMPEEGDTMEVGKTREEPTSPMPVIRIEQPLEAKQFDQFLDIFMSRTGISERHKAAILAARALQNIGINPAENLQQAVQATQFLTSVLNILPNAGEVTAQTKDIITAHGVSRMGEKLLQEPTPDERMERVMAMMMPYIMVLRLASGGDMGGPTGTKEVEALRSEFERFRNETKETDRDKTWGDRFSKLESKLETLGARKPEEGDATLKKLDELKEAMKEGRGKSEVSEKLDELIKATKEKQETDKFDEVKAWVGDMKSGLEAKIGGLETSMDKGEPKQDVMTQATELISSMGSFYKNFGEAAKTLGFESKDDKVTGDLRKDLVKMGRDVIEVVGRAVEHRAPPAKQEVQTLPESITIPIPSKPPKAPSEPAVAEPQEVPPEGPPAVRPFAKKPKPEAPAETPAEAPPETPAETPPENPAEEKPPDEG